MIQSLKMALKSIAGNKMRAFLTMLGIIIGVMALVILVSLVNGATSTVTDTISSLGNNLISVRILDDKGKPVYISDLNEWMQEPGIGLTAPIATETMTGRHGANNANVSVNGTTPALQDVQGLKLVMGRFIKATDETNHSYVCVINETAGKKLVGYTDCVGEEISLNGTKFTVVGVLKDDEDSLTSMLLGGSATAYIPYSALLRLSSSLSPAVTSFYVSADVGSTMQEAEDTMNKILMERFNEDEDAFSSSTLAALEDAMGQVTGILEVLMGGIAAISLIVGGIGIMNIMLVTVTERTREIGIRKAVGATRHNILLQFLLEAIVLCMMGCIIGILLSWSVLQLISTVVSSLSMTFRMQGNVVAVSVLFCFTIAIVFGLYPANKAAKMQPIDALHYGG